MPLYKPDSQPKQFARISLMDYNQYGTINAAYRFTANPTSGGPVINKATYYPITINSPVTAYRMWYATGATAASSATVDMGIYYESGVKVVSSGLVNNPGTSFGIFYCDITDTPLPAGSYYLGWSSSSGSIQIMRYDFGAAQLHRGFGQRVQLSAHPLPGTATFANTTQAPFITMMGIDIRNY